MRWLSDENFNNEIVRGLRRREPAFDVIRIQDAGLTAYEDPLLLAWAAEQGRILLTHDMRTMPRYDRINRGLAMPGVVQVSSDLLTGSVIDEIVMMDACSYPGEWEGQVVYLPL